MKKSTKILTVSLAAVIALTAAVIGTVLVMRRVQSRDVAAEYNTAQEVAESAASTQSGMASETAESAQPSAEVSQEEVANETLSAVRITTKPTTEKSAAETTAKPITTTSAAAKPTAATPAKGRIYTLALAADGGVSEIKGAGKYKAGESVTVSASLLLGKYFDRWASSDPSLLADGKSATYSFKMPAGNVTLKAITYSKASVTIKKGQGVASVEGEGTYPVGQTVTVSATMEEGYDFAGWTGSILGNSISYSFKMPDSPVVLTATGRARYYRVNLTAGTGISSVSGSGSYRVDDTVCVRASVEQNYTFKSWGGESSNTSYSFKMPAHNVSLTAYAQENPKYTVTVSKGDAGISSVRGGGTFYAGTQTKVSCTVAAGYAFSGWYSSNNNLLKGSETLSYTFYMPKGNVTLTAKSVSKQYKILLSKSEGIAAVNGSGEYTAGKTVTVSCTVSTGYQFKEWVSSNTKALRGSFAQSYSFTMPQASIRLTAKATKVQYKLTVKCGTGIAAVRGGGVYNVGDVVTIDCTPQTGYAFTRWKSSNTSLMSDSYVQNFSFNMPKGNITLTANAEKVQYTVTLSSGSGIVSVSGGGTYTAGDTVTVYAEENPDYWFDCWTENGSVKSRNQAFTFTMPKKDVSLKAYAKPY